MWVKNYWYSVENEFEYELWSFVLLVIFCSMLSYSSRLTHSHGEDDASLFSEWSIFCLWKFENVWKKNKAKQKNKHCLPVIEQVNQEKMTLLKLKRTDFLLVLLWDLTKLLWMAEVVFHPVAVDVDAF